MMKFTYNNDGKEKDNSHTIRCEAHKNGYLTGGELTFYSYGSTRAEAEQGMRIYLEQFLFEARIVLDSAVLSEAPAVTWDGKPILAEPKD